MAERITGYTQLIGLIAKPIKHSVSPAMHNAAFAHLGLDYAYLAFEVEEDALFDAVKAIRALKMAGSNVSMPYKAAVIPYMDKLSPVAELCGAVNTIVNEGGELTGHLTDGTGYMEALKDSGIDVIGKKITVVGAGGAATAIEIQAAFDGVKEISIFNIRDRFWQTGEDTVRKINEKTNCKAALYDLADTDALRREISESCLLTNATGLGMKPTEGRTWLPDTSFLRPDLIVTDTIYSPPKTRLLELAEQVGCQTMNGLGMIIFQGAAGFKMWTGKDMPINIAKEILGISHG